MSRSRSKDKKRSAPIARGDRLELIIESLEPGGQGVAKTDGFPIFLDRAAPQDKVRAYVYDVRKSFALAKIEELLEASPQRITAPCPVYDKCGGCQWQHLDYDAQLAAKKEIVIQALTRIGGLSADLIQPPLGAAHQMRYRNKAQFPVRSHGSGSGMIAGYFEKNSHNLVDIDACPVQPEDLDDIFRLLKESCIRQAIEPYEEGTHSGLLRHMLIRKSHASGEALVTLVVNLKGPEELDKELLEKFKAIAADLMNVLPTVAGFCINFNPKRGNRILSDDTVCLVGSAVIEEVLESKDRRMRFRLSSNSFFQIHSEQNIVMLDKILQEVEQSGYEGKPVIMDAYAGVGTIALWLAPLAARVYAVEENPFAAADGRTNALLNNAGNIDFREGKAEVVLEKFLDDGINIDILILDPPRKGLSESVLNSVLKLAPEHLIYVSCNPTTLARDLKLLEAGLTKDECSDGEEKEEEKISRSGYKTLRVTPIDMFPQTYHVESVASLKRSNSNGTIGNLQEV
ncbi:MAG: 23S rRNA (uracil(1939)-C(5))-methyltransferase RlmD [Candidatus Obscuribacterales bacterium]|nr:23S rRNA (uracil(1939)-C(5))-methyltransferase RlmD [Candidatus Obscuribacterales bacterium]